MSHSAQENTGKPSPGSFGRRDEKGSSMIMCEVWVCRDPQCPCWMRKEMAFAEQPRCPLCRSEMDSAEKLVPKLMP